MLVDSHCHLDRLDLDKLGLSLDQLLDNARSQGVKGFLSVGVDLDSSARLIELSSSYKDVFVSVGVHPLQDVAQPVPSIERLVELGNHNKVVAIGETGLDNHYAPESSDWQTQSFRNHLLAASELGKPVIVHTREARDETLGLIQECANQESAGVLHCFTESWEMAKAALDMNFYISFSGIITFRNAEELREVVKKVPLDRILVETDCPWLAPVPHRGKQNEPRYVVDVARQVAKLKNLELDQLAEITTGNFNRLFNTTQAISA